MDDILDVVVNTSKTRPKNDDDFADRLSSRYTVVQLITFAILVGLTQYVRTPMTCWAPVHFTGSHTDFTNNYCWIKNTYYLPWADQIPRDWEDEKRQMIPYYQWIPFVLLIQAVLFYLPYVVWHGFNSKAGINTDSILLTAQKLSTADSSKTDESSMRLIVNLMDRFLNTRHKPSTKCCRGCCCCCTRETLSDRSFICGRRTGSYLLILFLLAKFLYIGNAVGQLLLLDKVLSTKYSTFGADIVRQMVDNVDWTEESYVAFPRVTLCEFKVRGQDMANVHPYTVQCVLPINIYNEKIYVYLWFWMIFVASVSVLSLVHWFIQAALPRVRFRFVIAHISDRLDDHFIDIASKRDAVDKFTNNYLQVDGVLLLRLIAHNTDSITVTEIAGALFDAWIEREVSSTSKAIELLQDSEESASLAPMKTRFQLEDSE